MKVTIAFIFINYNREVCPGGTGRSNSDWNLGSLTEMVLVPLGQLCITNVDDNVIVVTSSMVGELSAAIRNLFSSHLVFSRANDIF